MSLSICLCVYRSIKFGIVTNKSLLFDLRMFLIIFCTKMLKNALKSLGFYAIVACVSFYIIKWDTCDRDMCHLFIMAWSIMFLVETLEILSRVFLFHFEKFSGHFSLFRVFWEVSVNTSRNSRFDLKKKKILKPKQIRILYIEKP